MVIGRTIAYIDPGHLSQAYPRQRIGANFDAPGKNRTRACG